MRQVVVAWKRKQKAAALFDLDVEIEVFRGLIKRARADFRELASQFYHGEVELEHVRQRVASFLAYAKHCNAQRTVEGVLGDLVLVPGLRDIVYATTGNSRQFVSR